MGGRASLFLVLGFSLIFMVAGNYFNNMATGTTDNMIKYYQSTKAHNIAASGVNLIVNKLFLDATIPDQTFNFNFDGGTATGVLTTTDTYQNIKRLLCTGTFNGTSTTIRIIFKPSLFSKYAYFSNSEGSNIWWTSGDTVKGPFHTNSSLNVSGHPTFFGRVTIGGSINKYNSSSSANFLGGFQQGIQIAIPNSGVSNVATIAAQNGAQFSNKSLIYFEFRRDSVRYRFSTSGSGSTWTYNLASTFAPNGVIYASNAELHISGTVKGQYTIAASGTNSTTQGNVYLDGDIVYNSDPRTNPNSTDMLGIVAQENVYVTDNTANNTNGININASIYCQSGSFTAQNYSTRPAAGYINLYGGITQYVRGPVGTFTTDWYGNSYINHGFNKNYQYDNRLLVSYPPAYPGCGTFEVVSWFE